MSSLRSSLLYASQSLFLQKKYLLCLYITTDCVTPVYGEEEINSDTTTENVQENTTFKNTNFCIGDTVVYTEEKFAKIICVIFKVTSSRYKTYYFIRPITDQPHFKGNCRYWKYSKILFSRFQSNLTAKFFTPVFIILASRRKYSSDYSSNDSISRNPDGYHVSGCQCRSSP